MKTVAHNFYCDQRQTGQPLWQWTSESKYPRAGTTAILCLMHFAGLDAKKVLFNSNALQWWVGHVWCVFALWSYLTMVEHLSSRRPALPGHSGASLTQLEILGDCVISLESEMGKIFSTWLFQTAPDKVWQVTLFPNSTSSFPRFDATFDVKFWRREDLEDLSKKIIKQTREI